MTWYGMKIRLQSQNFWNKDWLSLDWSHLGYMEPKLELGAAKFCLELEPPGYFARNQRCSGNGRWSLIQNTPFFPALHLRLHLLVTENRILFDGEMWFWRRRYLKYLTSFLLLVVKHAYFQFAVSIMKLSVIISIILNNTIARLVVRQIRMGCPINPRHAGCLN